MWAPPETETQKVTVPDRGLGEINSQRVEHQAIILPKLIEPVNRSHIAPGIEKNLSFGAPLSDALFFLAWLSSVIPFHFLGGFRPGDFPLRTRLGRCILWLLRLESLNFPGLRGSSVIFLGGGVARTNWGARKLTKSHYLMAGIQAFDFTYYPFKPGRCRAKFKWDSYQTFYMTTSNHKDERSVGDMVTFSAKHVLRQTTSSADN